MYIWVCAKTNANPTSRLRVQGAGCRVWGLEFRVWSLKGRVCVCARARDLRGWGAVFRLQGLGVRVWGQEVRV